MEYWSVVKENPVFESSLQYSNTPKTIGVERYFKGVVFASFGLQVQKIKPERKLK